MNVAWRGDFVTAESLVAESDAITKATGTRIAPYTAVLLAGLRGFEAAASELIEAVMRDVRVAAQGGGIQLCLYVSAILYNGLGKYERALRAAESASEEAPELYVSMWALPELIEAATRSGERQLAAGALARLAEATSVSDTDWALGIPGAGQRQDGRRGAVSSD